MHVVLDLFDCDALALADKKGITRFLKDAVAMLGMTAAGKPSVQEFDNEEPGITGVQVITESHLAIHTFPQRRLAWVDLFSCKDFDAKALVAHTVMVFHSEQASYQVLERDFKITRPRELAPWFRTGLPAPEEAPA